MVGQWQRSLPAMHPPHLRCGWWQWRRACTGPCKRHAYSLTFLYSVNAQYTGVWQCYHHATNHMSKPIITHVVAPALGSLRVRFSLPPAPLAAASKSPMRAVFCFSVSVMSLRHSAFSSCCNNSSALWFSLAHRESTVVCVCANQHGIVSKKKQASSTTKATS